MTQYLLIRCDSQQDIDEIVAILTRALPRYGNSPKLIGDVADSQVARDMWRAASSHQESITAFQCNVRDE